LQTQASGIRPRTVAPPAIESDATPMPMIPVEDGSDSMQPAQSSTGITTRPRRAHEADSLEGKQDELSSLQNNPAINHNSRWKSMLINAAQHMSENAQQVSQGAAQSGRPVDMYGIANILGGAGGGAVGAAINPAVDEERKRHARMSVVTQQIGQQVQLQKIRDEHDQRAAQTRVANSNADYNEAIKPRVALGDMNRKDAQASSQALRQHQQSIIQNLGQLKGQQLDPSNPMHAAFLDRVQQAGLFVDPEAWNNAASNVVPIEVVDPENPTQKRKQFFNKATGELTDAAQSGYVQPVNADSGMTSSQEFGVQGRQASQAETQRHNATTEAQGEQRIGQGAQRIGISRTRGGSGVRGDGSDGRSHRASVEQEKLIDAIRRADSATGSKKSVFQSEVKRRADLIKSQYGDLVADDPSGWGISQQESLLFHRN
jgi:hypothetical protein